MSRSGYCDDYDDDPLVLGRWRAQVASAVRGKRGQAFMRDLIAALDALPDKRLIPHELNTNTPETLYAGVQCGVCALGSVGVKRGVNLDVLDPYDHETLSGVFGIASQLVQEIEYMNDEGEWRDTPERRWQRMRAWAVSNLKTPPTPHNRDGQ